MWIRVSFRGVLGSGGRGSNDVAFEKPVGTHWPGRQLMNPERVRQQDTAPTDRSRRPVTANEQGRDEHRHAVDEAGLDEGPVERASAFEECSRDLEREETRAQIVQVDAP